MQAHLDVEQPLDDVGRRPHVGERLGLVDRQRIGTGEMDQEEIVLRQVVAEGRLGQVARAEPPDEGMLDIGPPIIGAACLQPLEEAIALAHVRALRSVACCGSGPAVGRRGRQGLPRSRSGSRGGKSW